MVLQKIKFIGSHFGYPVHSGVLIGGRLDHVCRFDGSEISFFALLIKKVFEFLISVIGKRADGWLPSSFRFVHLKWDWKQWERDERTKKKKNTVKMLRSRDDVRGCGDKRNGMRLLFFKDFMSLLVCGWKHETGNANG